MFKFLKRLLDSLRESFSQWWNKESSTTPASTSSAGTPSAATTSIYGSKGPLKLNIEAMDLAKHKTALENSGYIQGEDQSQPTIGQHLKGMHSNDLTPSSSFSDLGRLEEEERDSSFDLRGYRL